MSLSDCPPYPTIVVHQVYRGRDLDWAIGSRHVVSAHALALTALFNQSACGFSFLICFETVLVDHFIELEGRLDRFKLTKITPNSVVRRKLEDEDIGDGWQLLSFVPEKGGKTEKFRDFGDNNDREQ